MGHEKRPRHRYHTDMILGVEIGITIIGLLLLIRGKTFGANAFAHPQLRWLGAVVITLMPVALFLALCMGMLYGINAAITNPQVGIEQAQKDLKVPLAIMEFGIVLTYAIGLSLWERSLRKRVQAEKRQRDQAQFEYQQDQ